MFERITVTLPTEAQSLRFWQLQGDEILSRSFTFSLSLLSTDTRIDRSTLLGKPVTINIPTRNLQNPTRYLNGKVTGIRVNSADVNGARYVHYQLEVESDLWPLKRDRNQRIFQNQRVPDIVASVLRDYGVNLEDRLAGSYRVWEYCVQYQESSYDFISRLMELEGIYYFFEHSTDHHTLVLADAPSVHKTFPGYATIPYHVTRTGASTCEQGIGQWTISERVTPGLYSTDDYDFRKPYAWMFQARQNPVSPQPGNIDYYEWPGHFVDHAHAEHYAKVRQQQWQADHQHIEATATALGIAPGYIFELTSPPLASDGGRYLVICADYLLRENAYCSGNETSLQQINMVVIPANVPFRPKQQTTWPRTHGPQTARVMGPKGQSIWTDRYGRVKVRFHWDRLSKEDDTSSCWVRVSSAWAGQGFGGIQIPRVQDEVVVDFVNGDPDRPIITGRVYNDAKMPPWALPAAATQMGILSRSKDGTPENANELRFEDKKGEEQVWIQAERNLDIKVKQNSSTTIGGKESCYVEGSELRRVATNRVHGVQGDEENYTGGSRRDACAGKFIIGSGSGLRLECGESVIEMTPEGVININGIAFNLAAKANSTITTGGGRLKINEDNTQQKLSPPGRDHLENIRQSINSLFSSKLNIISGETAETISKGNMQHRKGRLSMKYETGKTPQEYASAAATVSSGKGDPGGKSYGAYQLASSKKAGRQVQKFLNKEGDEWKIQFEGMDPEKAGDFEREWKRIAVEQPDKMFDAQHRYIERSHYSPVINSIMKSSDLDVSSRSIALQDVVWSTSVQHGKAAKIISDAISETERHSLKESPDFDEKLIINIYNRREEYVNSLPSLPLSTKSALAKRYDDELKVALEILKDEF